MKTQIKSQVRVWLGGSTVEKFDCDSVKEAKALAKRTKQEWYKINKRASVLYTNSRGLEVYA
jgi:hypothetical protein